MIAAWTTVATSATYPHSTKLNHPCRVPSMNLPAERQRKKRKK
jgi:hypothetical protein